MEGGRGDVCGGGRVVAGRRGVAGKDVGIEEGSDGGRKR